MNCLGSPRLKSTQCAIDELMIAWLAMGLTTLEIAGNLKVSDKTVQYRWARLKREYRFRCAQDATRFAIKSKIIPLKVHYE